MKRIIPSAALMLFVIGKDLMKYLGGWLGG